MIFLPTELPGVIEVREEAYEDERGSFGRVWCVNELEAVGVVTRCAQVSLSRNRKAGTIRGLHYAAAPFQETKLVRCTKGAILDVAVDVRPGSATYGRHVARRLEAAAGNALLIPPGFAHGFQTLADDADVLYVIDVPYVAAAARCLRFDDPALGIAWPLPVSAISERDRLA